MSMGNDYGPVVDGVQQLVLASSSPRRRELLGKIVPSFRVLVPGTDEGDIHRKEDLLAAASAKMRQVRSQVPDALIIAADTGVFCDGRHLGKPSDVTQAREYLRALSGRWHTVSTGLSVSAPSCEREELVETRVLFRRLSEGELDWYLREEQVLDKAGGYAVQGRAAVFVLRIEGDFFNVMGLPLATVYDLLRGLGWRPDGQSPCLNQGG